MSAVIYSFAEAKAQKLRKEDSNLGRIFRNLEQGPVAKELALAGVKDEVLIRWAVLLQKGDEKTISEVCAEVELAVAEAKANAQ